MPGFGCYNPFPFTCGGGESHVEITHRALMDQYRDVLNLDEDNLAETEAYAEAAVLSQVWTASERVGNQLVPERMLENLPVWEEAAGLQVNSKSTSGGRRAALASKAKAYSRNDNASVEEACARALGNNFVSLTFVADADEIVYWPGIFPGPPGLEWSSNRDIYIVTVSKNGLSQEQFNEKVAAFRREADRLVPAYARVAVTTGSGFIPSVSLVGEVGP